MNREDQRYTAVNAQIKQLLDDAAEASRSPVGMARIIGTTWLAAEMYDHNERGHMRWQEARMAVVQSLQQIIQAKESEV